MNNEAVIEIDEIVKNATPQERKVYNFLVKFQTEHLYPPTMKEISQGTGIKSTSGVSSYLDRLEGLGLIELHNTKTSRGITLCHYQMVKKG
mgnify:CR=1 FL=1